MDEMRAYVRKSGHNREVALQTVKVPDIADREVLVRVKAFGVGIHDRYFIPKDVTFPFVIGIEGSGIVVKAGKNVSQFQKKDRVILSSSMLVKGGSWAEYVAVPVENLIKMPEDIDFRLAAILPVAGKTGAECMHALNLKKGDTLFVAGATGAIGTFIIQMARNIGVHVAGSASRKNPAYMKGLGAKKAVDYTQTDWKKDVCDWSQGGVDAALAIQPDTGADSQDVVKDGGKVVTVSGDHFLAKRNIHIQQIRHELSLQTVIAGLMKDISAGTIQAVIEKEYPFSQALDALAKTETRHAQGKSLVLVD